ENLGQAITLYYDGVGVPGFTPSKEIFYIAAAVAVLTFIPLLFAYLHDKKERVVIAENQVEE
ncbi:MAG TPA: hypothetical protein PK245_01335, partial [Clostridia bacterium]|nr:hypothetical protein [Clostridia bacterium]